MWAGRRALRRGRRLGRLRTTLRRGFARQTVTHGQGKQPGEGRLTGALQEGAPIDGACEIFAEDSRRKVQIRQNVTSYAVIHRQ